jgi:hypothetical protein
VVADLLAAFSARRATAAAIASDCNFLTFALEGFAIIFTQLTLENG